MDIFNSEKIDLNLLWNNYVNQIIDSQYHTFFITFSEAIKSYLIL